MRRRRAGLRAALARRHRLECGLVGGILNACHSRMLRVAFGRLNHARRLRRLNQLWFGNFAAVRAADESEEASLQVG